MIPKHFKLPKEMNDVNVRPAKKANNVLAGFSKRLIIITCLTQETNQSTDQPTDQMDRPTHRPGINQSINPIIRPPDQPSNSLTNSHPTNYTNQTINLFVGYY